MRYMPIGSNLLVEPIEDEQAIITTEKSPNTPVKGIVREIGPGEWLYTETPRREPMEVRPSSIVYFFPRQARYVSILEKEYYIIDQSDLLFVEEDK